ncbi:putative cytochrome P450 [Talaromyces proteolyticus]|uniref:Cytochrome P450 n=1 Tax=Talaromyces proteolyticus TaxID=1131652 RepID=A0AAD4L248_9EURO|nr:putative cytochrome P450 [Talaromyces proteolyticus]KAH8705225.1 putative cytochrome P450 [Talaromyces proteolyticus]
MSPTFSWERGAYLALASGILYVLCGAVYRLYFHPLSKFPGPKMAAVTGWYETYHDLVRRGMFVWEIQRMHEKYGPIIRINPNELHIKDSEFFDELYAPASKKRDKYKDWVILSGTPNASFSTVAHTHHRLRRSALNPFFSKKVVGSMEPLILEKIERLATRFTEAAQGTGDKPVLRLDAAFMALTMDIICHYAYGESYNYLADEDFRARWREAIVSALENGILLRNFPWMLPLLQNIPYWVLQRVNPNAAALMEWSDLVKQKVDIMMKEHNRGNKASGTIFHTVLDSELPPEEKSAARLLEEGQSVVGAGSETTANTLTIITFYLSSNKTILRKLRTELESLPAETPMLPQLEKLPYLTAVICEGLRLNVGVMSRSPRIAHEVIRYKEWSIPSGTPVSESTYFVLQDPEIFPNPEEFIPERWIEAQQSGFRLDRFLVCFSKGSRACLGINLAYAELYLTLAKIIPRFEFELFETDVTDIKPERDFFVPVARLDSKGVRAKVSEAL